MLTQAQKSTALYAQPSYQDPTGLYHIVQYTEPQNVQSNLQYTSVHPSVNSEARNYFERHMRILEQCMGAWPMPEMQKQIDSVREAFSADMGKPFMLKSSFPYGSPHSATSSPPNQQYRHDVPRSGSLDQQVDTRGPHSQVSYISHPITPVSASQLDIKSDSPDIQSLAMMASGQSQASSVQHSLPLPDASTWNPGPLFEQWNSSIGAPPAQSTPSPVTGPPGPIAASDPTTLQDIQAQLQSGSQTMEALRYKAPPVLITPACARVASVYEGGLKRAWDYDSHMGMGMKRH
ncbi:hypothetical protein QBC47DRAFT_346831 [Echria macrotheca]|uniref:Uncharacterized protein n=1 Tax=Echria macrotheca TaxID=438768 RepID=A0AAJ0BCC7_9PEZI|nr:hypothetical protein QBC47DRAFT_346831 [Echria macrotheca]